MTCVPVHPQVVVYVPSFKIRLTFPRVVGILSSFVLIIHRHFQGQEPNSHFQGSNPLPRACSILRTPNGLWDLGLDGAFTLLPAHQVSAPQ